jgi:hypothetical protein
MSIKIKVSHRRKTTGFKIIILLLTIFGGIMGCRRNGLSVYKPCNPSKRSKVFFY